MSSETPSTLKPGDRAPQFDLPVVTREGRVALADYRGHAPVLLVLFRGLYCPFCRRQMIQFAPTADALRARGIETVAVVATAPERARLYFRLRPPRYVLAADPDLVTHRAYGLPWIERDDTGKTMVEAAARVVAREVGVAVTPGEEARETINRLDGFEPLASDMAERDRHRIQLTGQFLVDRDGSLRWCRTETRASYALFPAAEELLALAE